MFQFPLPCLVTEVVTTAPAVGETVPGVVANIGGRDEETAPAEILDNNIGTFLVLCRERERKLTI